MYIDQILYPIKTLGPGKRIGIWTVGCRRKCPGCSNPELWNIGDRKDIPVSLIIESIKIICRNYSVDGFTITGGEPLEQHDIVQLVKGLNTINLDILLFSGFTYEKILNDPHKAGVLDFIGVLIDGAYHQENNSRLVLRGSTNQRILLFEPDLEELYCDYISQDTSKIQNFHFHMGNSLSVGIHSKTYQEDLKNKLKGYGVIETSNL